MENIAQILTQPWMVYVFVLTILLVALRPLYQAVFSIGQVNRDLYEAIRVLAELGKNRQDEFYDQFKTVNTNIVKITGLRHAWREFVDSLYFESTSLPGTHKKVYLSHRPSHYFNRESVLGTRLNLSQFLAYPNYLIGIGLTFTFIGLAAALHVAQAGMVSGAGQQALKALLAVASIKFISSIVGIASSLAVSALQRDRMRVFQQKLNYFCELLEECTKFKSTEKLLHDSFSEQRVQTALLSGMGRNIAQGINESISHELAAGITQALDPLMQDIRALSQHFAGGSEAALGKMLAEFMNSLHNATGAEMNSLLASIRELQQSLDTLTANMRATGSNFNSDVAASSQALKATLEQFSASFIPVQQGMAQFSQSLASLGNVGSRIDQAGENIKLAAEQNRQVAAELARVIASLPAQLAPAESLFASLAESLAKVEKTANALDEAGGKISAASEGFSHAAAMIGQTGSALHKKIETFETTSRSLAGAAELLEKASRQIESSAKELGVSGKLYLTKLKSWFK